jgi:cyanophycinase
VTQAGPLHWRTGAGWLLVAGGGAWQKGETDAIDAAALGWASPDQPIAILPTGGGSTAEGEALLEYYADLGGPNGYIVPIFDAASARQEENCQLLREAGLIYISDGPDVLRLVRTLRESPALYALAYAFDIGAVVVGTGIGAAAMGAWVASDASVDTTGVGAEPGLEWLPGTIVEPHFRGTKTAVELRRLLQAQPNCLGLGIPKGTALALGPEGQVETVGDGEITVVIGQNVVV